MEVMFARDALVRGVVVDHRGGPEQLTVREINAPIAKHSLVEVDVEAVGVNPVDIGNRVDPRWAGIAEPYVVGYEFSGRVVTVGDSAPGIEPGQAVWGLLPVRGTQWGAMSERVTVHAEFLAPLPPELDAVTAAALPLAGATALQVIERLDLPPESWLLVHGASGGVGHLLVQIARNRGLHVAAATRADDHERMAALGVEVLLDRGPEPAIAVASALGRPVDAVVDLVGGQLASSAPYVAEGGQLASIVNLEGDLEPAIDRNLTIHGVLVRPGRAALESLALEVRRGLRPHIALTLPLERAEEAHRSLAAGGTRSKIVLTPFSPR